MSSESGVGVVVGEGIAHYNNLQSCGSVHACPVCAPKIRQERADEIERGLERHFAQGGGAEFLTLTLRHYRGEDLAQLVELVSAGFSSLLAGRQWLEDKQTYGIVGTIRSMEITHGENGWHPHLHVLVLTSGRLSDRARALLAERIYGRWCRAVERAGVAAPSRAHGLDLRPVERAGAPLLGSYLQKGDVADELALRAGGRRVGLELARHDLKDGRRESVTPWGLLAEFSETGDLAALGLWLEYEKATAGRQSLTWSKGLKKLLLVEELTDEELAELVQGGEVVTVIDAGTWARAIRCRGFTVQLLEVAEDEGVGGVELLLRTLLPRAA